MLRRKFIKILAVALFATMAVLYRPASSEAAEDWNFALLLPLTGPFASWAEGVQFAVHWAAEEANKAGGIDGRMVKITDYDTALDPATAVARINEAMREHTIILGPFASGIVSATMPAVQRAGAFAYVANSGEQAVERFRPHLFNLWTDFGEAVEKTMAGYVKLNPDVKSIAVIYNPMDEFWVRFAKFQENSGNSLGLKVHPLIEIGQGASAAAAATKAMSYNADAYFVTGLNQDMIDSLLELGRRGVTDQRRIMFYPLADDPAFAEVAQNVVDGAYVWNVFNRFNDNPRWTAFTADYQAAHDGLDPGLLTIPYIDAVSFVRQAIEQNGLTGDADKRQDEWAKIIKFMAGTENFPGVTQSYNVIDYQMHGPAYLMQFDKNGKLGLVEEYQ
ncbi:MAG: ABC transporter substrate-binding protein [Rhodospirillaceae bacterium]|nr:ABC transporter substrate-binding protein [Rhodospirillaceae bacterium]MBT3626800.1 ABC transporter substrate-binding protein [Rhodospirillaceae bacterium]MBT5040612.1 ABC transporter substrate-binding protein [Rhodospirillaceae bacterium]MBT6830119.1 ABC transporter substrate-binding protein [Rhodospirillaceae bacterium]MBT7292507.1 ABC transporter substrate-binding protein [Rhodospirillaceae bacterium]